jgi:hypothetical protein
MWSRLIILIGLFDQSDQSPNSLITYIKYV